jgi:hypothetical protein
VDVQVQGGLKLVRLEGCEQGWSDRVVEHRGHEGSEDVAGRVREILGGRKRQLDRTLPDIRVDELQTQRGRSAGHRHSSLDRIPERP